MGAAIWALAAWLTASSGWPGPSRGGRPDAPDLNATCEACHADVAREWRGSLHQRSYLDDDFADALAREPSAFCRGCHAPEADPGAPAPPGLAALGVGCVTCHLPGATILAAPRTSAATVAAPHPVQRVQGFAGAAACASCHEFGFPGRPQFAMQRTVGEHAASAHADTACATCHMPRRADGRRDHGFAASRDPALLRRSLRVTASRRATALHLVLEPGWVGHAVPTGDLFRRLVVEAEVADAQWQVLAHDARELGRRFTATSDGRAPIADDRVGADGSAPTGVVLELGEAAVGREIRWRVQYERVAFGSGAATRVWDSVTIAEGVAPDGPARSRR